MTPPGGIVHHLHLRLKGREVSERMKTEKMTARHLSGERTTN